MFINLLANNEYEVHIQNSTAENKEIMKFTSKWNGIEKSILSEATEVQKDKYWVFSLICES